MELQDPTKTPPVTPSDEESSIVTVRNTQSRGQDQVLQLLPDQDQTTFELTGYDRCSGGLATITEMTMNETSTEDGPDFASFDEYFPRASMETSNEMSINDKMKNVLKELKQNERVRLSWSRSMTEAELEDAMAAAAGAEDGDEEEEETNGNASLQSYEERTGSNGTVFMVRERLINDFYTHTEEVSSPDANENFTAPVVVPTQDNNDGDEDDDDDNCKIFQNPNAFLELERTQLAREKLTLDLKARKGEINAKIMEGETMDVEKDELLETPETEDAVTPTTPTAQSGTANRNKKKRKGKKKK